MRDEKQHTTAGTRVGTLPESQLHFAGAVTHASVPSRDFEMHSRTDMTRPGLNLHPEPTRCHPCEAIQSCRLRRAFAGTVSVDLRSEGLNCFTFRGVRFGSRELNLTNFTTSLQVANRPCNVPPIPSLGGANDQADCLSIG